MSALVNKFKKAQQQRVESSRAATTISKTGKAAAKNDRKAKIAAKIKKGKQKAKKVERKEESSESEDEEDDTTAAGRKLAQFYNQAEYVTDLVNLLSEYMRYYYTEKRMSMNSFQSDFPSLYNLLTFYEPMTDEDYAEIRNDRRLRAILETENIQNQLFSTDVARDVAVVNTELLQLNTEYLDIRTALLRAIQPYNALFAERILKTGRFFSDNDMYVLSADFKVPDAIIKTIEDYNRILSAVTGSKRPEYIEFIEGRTISRQSVTDFKTLIARIKGIHRAAVDDAAEDDGDDSDGEDDGDEYKFVKQGKDIVKQKAKPAKIDGKNAIVNYIKKYHRTVMKEIAKETDRNEADVSMQEVMEFILIRENIPYMLFLLDVVRENPETTEDVKLLAERHPEISVQFIRIYTRLSYSNRVEFVNYVFSRYPLEDYSMGPPVPILRLLITHYNRIIKTVENIPADTLTEKLTIATPIQLMEYVHSFNPIQLLVYRQIIFSKLSTLSETDKLAVIKHYKPFLTFGRQLSITSDNIVLENNLPVDYLNFMVPDDQLDEIRRATEGYVRANLAQYLNMSQLTAPLSVEDIESKLVAIGNSTNTFLSVFWELLSIFFSARIPDNAEIKNIISETIHANMVEYFDQKQFGNLNVAIPESVVKGLEDRIDREREEMANNVKFEHVEAMANRLGLNLGSFLPSARKKAIAKLDAQLEDGSITKDQFDLLIIDIDSVIAAYKNLKKKENANDPDLKAKRAMINNRYRELTKILEEERIAKGEEVISSEIEAEALAMAAMELNINEDELELLQTKYIKGAGAINRKRNRAELTKIANSMPVALRVSLRDMIEAISTNIAQSNRPERKNMDAYYKFVTDLSIAIWGLKGGKSDIKTIEQVEQQYIDQGIVPLAFIKKIILMTKQSNVTGMDLYNYVRKYISGTIKILKNPLVRNFKRRKERHGKIYSDTVKAGTLSNIRDSIPVDLPDSVKETIAIHMIKPWLDIPFAKKWRLLIAAPSGLRRDQLPENQRKYFNVSPLYQLALQMPDGQLLYFYRPTVDYWIVHYNTNHKEKSCDADSLIKTLTTSSGSAEFYELLVKDPIQGTLINGDLIVDYSPSAKFLNFISMNPANYEKECAWFVRREKSVDYYIEQYKAQVITNENSVDIRQHIVDELLNAITSLRLKLGINDSANMQKIAEQLEQLLFDKHKSMIPNPTAETYYNFALEYILFINPSDPIGKYSTFFKNLVAQAGSAYFPALVDSHITLESKFPEVLMNNYVDNDVKNKIREYVQAKIRVKMDAIILAAISPGVSKYYDIPSSTFELLSKREIALTAIIPEISDNILRNVCANNEKYKNVPKSWLMYYTSGDNVYCLSKLELSQMAKSGVYELDDVKFDKKFVDRFATYTEFAADELRKRNMYVENIAKALVTNPANFPLLDELMSDYNLFGEFDTENLSKYGIFKYIQGVSDGGALIDIVTNKINNILQTYNNMQVMASAKKFIKENTNSLKDQINDSWKTYHQSDPSSPEDAPYGILSGEYNDVLAPAVDVVVNSIMDTTPYSVNDRQRDAITEYIDNALHTDKIMTIKEYSCEECKARVVNAPYTSTVTDKDDMTAKLVKFCSAKCFSDFKIEEPSDDDLDLLVRQSEVNKLTKSYLNYTEMLMLTKFPLAFAPPKDPAEYKEFSGKLAAEYGVSPVEIDDYIKHTIQTESLTGIPRDKVMSQAELWDRIRIHPKFIPSFTELLDPAKLDALMSLTKEFDIPMYRNNNVDEVIDFYIYSPEELRDVWRKLRSNTKFQHLLYSTVSTIDPYKVDYHSPNLMNYLDAPEPTHPLPKTIWERVADGVRIYLSQIQDLEASLHDKEMFKHIRVELLDITSKTFPSLIMRFDSKVKKHMFMLRKTLELWFAKHQQLYSLRESGKKVDYNEYIKHDGDSKKGTMSFEQLLAEMNKYCQGTVTMREFTAYTNKLIGKNKNPPMMKFNIEFYPQVINKYLCGAMTQFDRDYAKFAFDSTKFHKLIDDTMADVIFRQRNTPTPSAGSSLDNANDRVIRQKTRAERKNAGKTYLSTIQEEAPREIKSMLVIEGEVPSALQVLRGIKPAPVRTRNNILADIKALTGNIRERERSKFSGRSTRTRRKSPEVVADADNFARDIEQELLRDLMDEKNMEQELADELAVELEEDDEMKDFIVDEVDDLNDVVEFSDEDGFDMEQENDDE